jgi:hypothetical protein
LAAVVKVVEAAVPAAQVETGVVGLEVATRTQVPP